MTHRLDLDSSLAKFEWGQLHAERFKGDVLAWAKNDADPAVSFRREFKRERNQIDFWTETVRPVRHSWGLVIGDAANNFRAALDHLAWELVASGPGLPTKDADRIAIQFPICDTTRKSFDAICERRLPGVSQRARDTLSIFQPYRSRIRTGRELIWLASLNQRDKHRQILASLFRPHTYDFTWPRKVKIIGAWTPPHSRGAFEPDTHVVSVRVSRWVDPYPDVRVKLDAARHVLLPRTEIPEEIPALDALGAIEALVGEILGKAVTLKTRRSPHIRRWPDPALVPPSTG